MLPKYHIILGFIFSLTLYFLIPEITLLPALIIWISSFMIDIDHYIYTAIKRKTINPWKVYRWHLKVFYYFEKHKKHKNEYYSAVFFLHGIEILIILFFLGIYFSEVFLFILIGFVFHLFLDLSFAIVKGYRLDKVSLIYDVVNYRNLNDINSLKEFNK